LPSAHAEDSSTLIGAPVNADQGAASSTSDPPALSPELVLVDPALAAWARERLPERPAVFAAAAAPAPSAAPPRRHADVVVSDRAAVSTAPGRQRRRRAHMAIAAGLAVAIALAAALVLELPILGDGARSDESSKPEADGPVIGVRGRTDSARTDSAVGPADPLPTRGRRFAWAPHPGASGYHVELFRGRALVFRADTSKPEILIPARWRLNGRTRMLEPGLYRWYVWPRIAGRRESTATVQAKFVVPTR
jgi:hypothetical protein